MSSGHVHSGVKLGDREVDQALADPAVRRRLARALRVSREWDIPFLGGYSNDGKTIYLDRHLPHALVLRDKGPRWTFDPDRFLILHEEVEKALIDELGFKYAHAHEVATRAEENAVRAAGIDVGGYRKVLRPFIKADDAERLLRVPKDLDMAPYRAPPVDEGLVRRIASAQKNPGPPGKIAPVLAHYGLGHANSHCGLCVQFRAPNHCAVVAGSVQPADWCSFFVRASDQQEKPHAAA